MNTNNDWTVGYNKGYLAGYQHGMRDERAHARHEAARAAEQQKYDTPRAYGEQGVLFSESPTESPNVHIVTDEHPIALRAPRRTQVPVARVGGWAGDDYAENTS